ncbi:MAG: guanylate kinase [Polyangiaceae bacterium]|nr:guanylate kinase [Polyangiaceae bacterium]
MSSDGPLLIIVSSPSGAGKTTLTNLLRQRIPELTFSVSHTTRPPRATERSGREYHFVRRPEFEQLVAEGRFLEWAEVHDHLYGTSEAELVRAQDARGVIFDVDHQGARQIKSKRPDAIAIFILPPSLEELRKRLKGRATETERGLERRFEAAGNEIAHYGMFDYLLVNDCLEEAVDKLVAIVVAEQCRRSRSARSAELLLAARRSACPDG